MKKLFLILTVLLVMFGLMAPAWAEPNGPPDGFILKDTDAAYAEFMKDGCSVFVGYVSGQLKFFGEPGGFAPHSDLEVKLSGDCSPTEGVVGTLGDPLAGIVELDSAFVAGIAVPLADGRTATVTLKWAATGETIRWNVTAPGMNARHKTRLADLTGSVVLSDGWSFGDEDIWHGEELDHPRITHYGEIQLRAHGG